MKGEENVIKEQRTVRGELKDRERVNVSDELCRLQSVSTSCKRVLGFTASLVHVPVM